MIETTIPMVVTEVTGGYKIVINGREGFCPKWEQIPNRVKDLLTPDFQKKAKS